MATRTVERLYEEARQLPPRERVRLGRLLVAEAEGESEAGKSFFDRDPFIQEIKAALASAGEKPFQSLEEAMSWSRGYEWRPEPCVTNPPRTPPEAPESPA